MNSEITYSSWRPAFHCVNCDQALGQWDRMYSDGICPACGHQCKGTICDTVKKVVRDVYELKPVFFGLIKQKIYIRTEIKEKV